MLSGRRLPACLTMLVISAWLGGVPAVHATPEQPSILILLSGQPGSPGATAIASGIRDVLRKDWSFRISIDLEHVDVADAASPEEEERRLRTIFGSNYANQRFDMIVAALPDAFRFVLRTRDELWPGTPVVVCGVDERSVRDRKLPPGFALLTTRFDTKGTLRAARALLPDTRHVALVGGAGRVEEPYHDLIRQAVSESGGLDVIDLTHLPIADVLTRVSSLPEHTVIMLSIYQVDGAGRRFNAADVVPHVANAANRPAFTQVTLTLGQGAVGGSVIDFEDIGRDAGRMTARMLRGAAAPSSPVPSLVTSVPQFDGRQLARWKLDERLLPEDSQVLFRRPTLWQEYHWHVASAAALLGAQTALIVTLLVQRRRRREAEAAMRQAEAAAQRHLSQIAHLDRVAAVGQLASSMAHELNQPLTAILANAQAAQRWLTALPPDPDDVREVRECLADIVSDDRRAGEVIRRVRYLLKRTDIVTAAVALNDLAANTIRLVTNHALAHSVFIDFLPAPAQPVVHGDTVQIQQVLLNLLTNAITAAANGGVSNGTVTVWTSVPTARYAELGVHDSGKGIAGTDLERIFEPFFTTRADGLGMGLTISRAIVEAHGGRLSVENDPAGGATFRVQLRTDQPKT
jgi:signal transduction histidine kinase